jgi:HK97 family phage major capsid protein
MGSDGLTIPKIVTGASPDWLPELAAMPDAGIVFGSVKLDAKTLRCVVHLSEELVEDMTAGGADAITRELVAAFALEVDRASLYGAGGVNEPLGVDGQAGVLRFATPTTLDYANLVSAAAAVRAGNHEPTGSILSAQAEAALQLLTATDEQPKQAPPGLPPRFVTNLVDAAGDAGDVVTADFRQLVIGARPQLGVTIRRIEAPLAETFSIKLAAWVRADVALVNASAFAINPDVAVPPELVAPTPQTAAATAAEEDEGESKGRGSRSKK